MNYRTVAEPFAFEPERIKGSRFLAALAPIASAAEGEAFVQARRALHPNASHTCFAWRVGAEGTEHRSSDDGEPAGSAGRPILAQIEGHELTFVAVTVARWFGGTKLGVGGLVRAYGGTAGMAMDRAPIIEREITQSLELRFPYDCTAVVQACLHAANLEPVDADYGSEVYFKLEVPLAAEAALRFELNERTSGRVQLSASSAKPGPP